MVLLCSLSRCLPFTLRREAGRGRRLSSGYGLHKSGTPFILLLGLDAVLLRAIVRIGFYFWTDRSDRSPLFVLDDLMGFSSATLRVRGVVAIIEPSQDHCLNLSL
jgi:hypothetical protein